MSDIGLPKTRSRPRVWLITNRQGPEILRPMFSILSRFVIHRPWAVILGWLVLTAGLHQIAPRWDQVTKDDDVRFFPPDSLSVIGQDLLERGFPADASSSQLVLVYERKHGLVTPDDLRYIEDVATKLLPVRPVASRTGDQEAGHASARRSSVRA